MGVDIKKSSDICPKCGGETYQRLDDTPEGVRKRLEVFRKETMSVVEYYRKRGILIEIDGRASIEEVSRNILSSLSRLKGE
jgi:adenylate kinase